MQDNILFDTQPATKPDPLESFGISERYQLNKVLGQGAYGVVW